MAVRPFRSSGVLRGSALALLGAAGWLGGCAGTIEVLRSDGPRPVAAAPAAALRRSLSGGFLQPALAPAGQPAGSTGSLFVRFQAPASLALKGFDMVVVDEAQQRVWRMDVMAGTLTGIAGAPADPAARVAIAPDLSVWVLDSAASRLLRFARDGRLLQTLALSAPLQPSARFAIADGGATVLIPGATLAQWIEVRVTAGIVEERFLRTGAVDRLDARVDAIAVSGPRLYLLDRTTGRVHVTSRDGVYESRIGQGMLRQPFALGVDRWGRVHVADGFDHSVKVFAADGALQSVMSREQLGVSALADIAVDDASMVVSDRVAGLVQLHQLAPPGAGARP